MSIDDNLLKSIQLHAVANCGYLNYLPMFKVSNDSVPKIDGYDDIIPVEGSTVTFTHPSGLVLRGPNTATCIENEEWEPDQDISLVWANRLLLTLNSLITLAFSAQLSVYQ